MWKIITQHAQGHRNSFYCSACIRWMGMMTFHKINFRDIELIWYEFQLVDPTLIAFNKDLN